MRKYLFTITTILFMCSFPAKAFMPEYPDDKEFEQCTKVSDDRDLCVREESRRSLNAIKRQFNTILNHPNIKSWHNTNNENIEIMRDLYESWTAFRNRLCSLAKVSTRFLEPITDEKDACTLYYTLHLQDHLNSVILLLDKKAPANRVDFDFLRIYDHDKLYGECMRKNMENECITEEMKRTSDNIKLQYKEFAKDPAVSGWNNSDDLESGNYRDMYDSWIAYRNRLCSLAVWAYRQNYGPQAITMNQCLQFYNREKFEALRNLISAAHSTLDEEDFETAEPQADDGGAAEGNLIPPLERKIEKGSKDSLTDIEKESTETAETKENAPQNNPDRNNLNIPSWANQ